MNEIVKALGNFLTRDFLYILGGTSVLVCVLYYFDKLPNKFENYELVYISSLGYVVGFLNQELFSLTHIITTAMPRTPNKLAKFFFKRFTYRKFDSSICDSLHLHKKFNNINDKINKLKYDNFQRIITLKHIGTTMASNGLVCSIFLFVMYLETRSSFDLFLFLSSLFTSTVLILLAWIKTLQQMEFVHDHLE